MKAVVYVLFFCLISLAANGNPRAKPADTLQIDTALSRIHWKGTKMRGAGKHEGTVGINNGFFTMKEGRLAGGNVTVDMRTIAVTDIPASDPVPIKKLTDHLKSDDFFDVAHFPEARFHIDRVEVATNVRWQVTGRLTIRGVTRTIQCEAVQKKDGILVNLRIDRFLWNVGYEGSWADRTLVDRDMELRIELRARKRIG